MRSKQKSDSDDEIEEQKNNNLEDYMNEDEILEAEMKNIFKEYNLKKKIEEFRKNFDEA